MLQFVQTLQDLEMFVQKVRAPTPSRYAPVTRPLRPAVAPERGLSRAGVRAQYQEDLDDLSKIQVEMQISFYRLLKRTT